MSMWTTISFSQIINCQMVKRSDLNVFFSVCTTVFFVMSLDDHQCLIIVYEGYFISNDSTM